MCRPDAIRVTARCGEIEVVDLFRAFPRPRARSLVPAALVALGGVACGAAQPTGPSQLPQGNAEVGLQHIADYGCGGCHVVPGLRGANGTVAAPLTDFGRRHYIAGRLPNNAENLTRWIMDPQQVDPETAMPDLGVSAQEARDIAAYLLSLR